MKRNVFLCTVLVSGIGAIAIAQGANEEPAWDKLSRHPVPEWFKDAKFGIYAHWGVYSVPTFGSVQSASFQRLGNGPDWSLGFCRRTEWSGGALWDLHIHDADFIRWCFGEPDAVVSTGSSQHVTTIYRYAHGPPHVLAEGGWLAPSGFSFRMGYLVVFEQAIAEVDLGGNPPLLLTRDGRTEAVALEPLTGYDLEIRHLIDAIAHGRQADLVASIADAEATARLLEAEQRSLETGALVAVHQADR